jgi:putative phosphoribosyl transferase
MHAAFHKRFRSRREAGRLLAKLLGKYAGDPETVVLALPKGGLEVGAEIAHLLALPFDVMLVDRITAPGCGDTPLGAITSGGVRMLNCAMIDRLHLSDEDVRNAILTKAVRLARRERLYRSNRPSIDVADRTVILADDGSSSCGTLRNSIRLLHRQHADHVIVAVPVTCHHAACDLRMEADEVISLLEPSAQVPAANWFESPAPIRSAEVCDILHEDFEEATSHY